jgi:hypothetical protein
MVTSAHNPRSAFFDPTLSFLFLLMLGAAAIVSGVYLFVRGFLSMSRKQLIENTPTSTIRAAAMGPVEVHGQATGPFSLISPVSQLDCYFYLVTAWSREGARGEKRWTQVAEEALCVPFFLQDETGHVLVDPRGIEINVPPSFDDEVHALSTTRSIQNFLDRHGLGFGGPVLLTEYTIQPDDALYALGTLAENRPSLETTNQHTVGTSPVRMLSGEAADLQRRMALELMQIDLPDAPLPSLAPAEQFDLSPPVSLQKGAAGRPFLLARHSERELVQTLARTSVRYIWGGPVLILAGLALVIWQLSPQ